MSIYIRTVSKLDESIVFESEYTTEGAVLHLAKIAKAQEENPKDIRYFISYDYLIEHD